MFQLRFELGRKKVYQGGHFVSIVGQSFIESCNFLPVYLKLSLCRNQNWYGDQTQPDRICSTLLL